MFVSIENKYNWKYTRDYTEIFKFLSEEIHSRYFTDCELIHMEGVAFENFKKLKPSIIYMVIFHSRFSNGNDQYAITTTKHLNILLCSLLYRGFVASLLTTMWYHTDGC